MPDDKTTDLFPRLVAAVPAPLVAPTESVISIQAATSDRQLASKPARSAPLPSSGQLILGADQRNPLLTVYHAEEHQQLLGLLRLRNHRDRPRRYPGGELQVAAGSPLKQWRQTLLVVRDLPLGDPGLSQGSACRGTRPPGPHASRRSDSGTDHEVGRRTRNGVPRRPRPTEAVETAAEARGNVRSGAGGTARKHYGTARTPRPDPRRDRSDCGH